MLFFNKKKKKNCLDNDTRFEYYYECGNCEFNDACKSNDCDHYCKQKTPCCATGATGPSGLSEYAYIYNLDAQVVAIEADVSFSSNGIIVGTITHAPGTSTIQIGSAGDYSVWFYSNGVEPNQFTLFQNGAPVSGSIYGSGVGTQGSTGMVIITAAAGDILTVRNHSSASAVTLQTLAGGTQINSNASILLQKLS